MAIERATLGQYRNEEWVRSRKGCITASMVGNIMKMKSSTPPESLVSKILGKSIEPEPTYAMKFGLFMEDYVAQWYGNKYKVELKECGLYKSLDNPWLAASPDRLVKRGNDEWLLEVKTFCPYFTNSITLWELAKEKKTLAIKAEDDNLVLDKDHNCYYQIITQMYCTGIDYCDVAFFYNNDFSVHGVEFDASYFHSNVLPVLKNFYYRYVSPEL